MAKRISDSEKWRDPWFSELQTELKLLWLYVLDNCNHAGLWKFNKKLAEFEMGVIPPWGEGVGGVPKSFQDRVVSNTEYWFIPKFLRWQYGESLKKGDAFRSAFEIIESKGFLEELKRVYGGSIHPHGRVKAKAKAKAKANLLLQEGVIGEEDFIEIWRQYPNKDGRKAALRHFLASVLNQTDLEDIKKALKNYLGSKKVREGFIKNGSTWFNNWRDWINYNEGGANGINIGKAVNQFQRLNDLVTGKV